jgi:hypothetical protein
MLRPSAQQTECPNYCTKIQQEILYKVAFCSHALVLIFVIQVFVKLRFMDVSSHLVDWPVLNSKRQTNVSVIMKICYGPRVKRNMHAMRKQNLWPGQFFKRYIDILEVFWTIIPLSKNQVQYQHRSLFLNTFTYASKVGLSHAAIAARWFIC